MIQKSPKTSKRLLRKGLWVGAGIFSLAFVVRLIYLYETSDFPTFYTPIIDSGEYDRIARSLAEGSGMGQEFFWQVFFYPSFLAVSYAVFGYSIVFVKMVQMLLGALVCALVFRLGWKIFDFRTGVLAGGITALYGPLIFFEGELLATGWAAFWAVVLLLVVFLAREKKSPWVFFIFGICAGLSVITRVTFLPFFGIVSLWFALDLRRSKTLWKGIVAREALLWVGFLLVVGSVATKCYRVTGRFSFLPETGSLNLYMGNNPDRDEIMALRPGSDWNGLLYLPIQHGAKSRQETQKFFMDRFWNYLKTKPLHFVGRLARKSTHVLSSREIPSNLDLYALRDYSRLFWILTWKVRGFGFPFGILLPLALLGLMGCWRRIPTPLVLFLIFYALAIILVFVTARYRAPMIPVLALLASAGFWYVVDTLKKGQKIKVVMLALVMVAVAFLSSFAGPFAAEEVNYEAEMYFCIGTEKRRQGRLKEAVPPLKAALELNPEYSDAHGELGYVRYQLGERKEAMIHLEKALELNPDIDSAHYNLGTALLDEGRVGEAIPHLKEALRIYPINAEVHYKLGSALGQQGKPREAIGHFEKALEINPRSYGIHYNLGLARLQLGEMEQGLEHLRAALMGAEAAGNQNMVKKIRSLVAQMKKNR